MENFVSTIFGADSGLTLFSKKGPELRGCFLIRRRSRIGGSVDVTKGIYEGSEVGYCVGRLLGQNRGTDDENGISVRLKVNAWNTFLRSGCGRLLGG